MTEAELLLEAEAMSGVGGFGFFGPAQSVQWSAHACRLHGRAVAPGLLQLADALSSVDEGERARVAASLNEALRLGQRGSVDYALAAGLAMGVAIVDAPSWGEVNTEEDLVRANAHWEQLSLGTAR